jgi:serine/threonine protein kinase
MSILTPTKLLAFLQEHEFLTPSQAQRFAGGSLTKFADGRMLARELVDLNWLTAYQANQLLQERGTDLVLGPYRILDRLGEGGMGQVFRAHHISMDRVVALKIIPRDLVSNRLAVGRFYREVRAVAKLSHPNIVTAFDANQAGQTHYLAMEFVEGIDLARLVQQSGPLPIPKACEYIRQAAVGLQHAHEKGLVHRDIKPGNLMVARLHPDEPPVIKILDFGLARFESESDHAGRLTQLGKIVGTVDYMAPEQAQDARTADIRADIYSLGCSLFYLLAGQPPFPGKDVVERIGARMLGDAPSVRPNRPEVSPALESVLAKMMARNPRDRYQTPGEVARALEPHTRGERRTQSSASSISDSSVDPTPWYLDTAKAHVQALSPTEKEFDFSQLIGELKPRRRVIAPLGIALALVLTLLGVLVGVVVLAGNSGDSDSRKGQALVHGDAHVDKMDRAVPGEKPPEASNEATVSKVYLSDLGGFDWMGYNGLGRGSTTEWEDTLKIRVGGGKYPFSLGTHPEPNNRPSQVKFLLRGLEARLFHTSVAVNDTATQGSSSPVTFVVLGDGKTLWTSKPVQIPRNLQECRINVSGIDVLELRASCPGSNGGAHAVWLAPYVTTELSKPELDKYLKTKPYPVDLRIVAVIDGSDELRITATETRWAHVSWTHPNQVKLNGIAWNPQNTPVMQNMGLPSLLGKQVTDMSKVRWKKLRGRGRVELRSGKDFVTVVFDDPEPGTETYEVVLTFPE